MGGLDPAKILIVLLLAVIILGPERLPKAARQLGSAWRELTKLRERLESEVRSAMPDLDLPKIPALPARGVAGYLTGMMMSSSGDAVASAGPATDPAGIAEPLLGAPEQDGADLFGATGRPGAQPATDKGRGRSPVRTSSWQTSDYETQPEHSELPAGWYSVGAAGPGYASGSNLAPVPSSIAAGPLGLEASLSFDEPSWN